MFCLLLTGLTLCSPSLAPLAAPETTEDHGKIAWHTGGLDAAAAQAREEGKLLFIDIFTDPCPACRLLDAQTFADPRVVTEMDKMICVAVNGTGDHELTQRFGVDLFPTLVFLEPDGSPCDKFTGFIGPRELAREARRILAGEETIRSLKERIAKDPDDLFAQLGLARKLKAFKDTAGTHRAFTRARALIERDAGFDPNDLDARYRIAQGLLALGDRKGFDAQVAKMRALDPESKSLPMRKLAFDRAMKRASENSDEEYLLHLLQRETEPELLFEGWKRVASVYSSRSQIMKARRKTDEAKEQRRFRRIAMREAWKSCPEDSQVEYGDTIARLTYDEYAETSPSEMTFAVDVARKVASLVPKDANYLDTLACCLMAAGEKGEAIETMKRCMKLDPVKLKWRTRLEMFEEDKVHP